MGLRELKGLELAARARITWDGSAWFVPSQSTGGTYRLVTWPGAESCECEDFQLRQAACKHIIAAKLVEERDGKRQAPPIDTDTPPPKKTYSQDWPLYNLAQTTEKHRLQVLLAELCRGVEEPPLPWTGRRPVPLADRLFACAFKVYSTFSSRRFACDLQDAHKRGHLSRLLHFNKVNCFLGSPDLTVPLRTLIERSSLPLRTVETAFAPDSTGFSASRHVKWFDEKYGVERSGHDWVKVHGGALNARRVAETMSRKITRMSPGQGFAANLVTALLVAGSSRLGLPVSTTQVSVGSLFGVGVITRTARAKTVLTILLAWVTTLPTGATLSAVLYLLLR